MDPTITLSGLDESVSTDQIKQLLEHPKVEFGLLYTATPEGRNRYPMMEWLESTTRLAADRCSIHICGRGARQALLEGQLEDLTIPAARIQINGILTYEEVEQACTLYPDHTIITQHHPRNAHLLEVAAKNHALLIDASGGEGITPSTWTRPKTTKDVGFAGGLGPTNLSRQLPNIAAEAAGKWFWVDMETSLRRDDWFSPKLAGDVLAQFDAWARQASLRATG
jgi:hypothetical protein